MRRLRGSLAAGVLVLVAATASCASLPDGGPVTVVEGAEPSASAAPFDFNPPGPRAGATQEQVASGFLSALQATPVTTRVAAQYLTAEAAERWRPARRTVVYTGQTLETAVGGVTVDLSGAFALDAVGRWQGAVSRTGDLRLRLPMVREDGEWRISEPPDAMVVPQAHFESRYRPYSLYFLDPTLEVLVPEPVYLPGGVQAPTLLVSGLFEGPATPRAERSSLPTDGFVGVGVPVSEDGVAQVPVGPEFLEMSDPQLEPALAQLAWTLRQVPEIERVQLTVDGVPVEVNGGASSVSVRSFAGYSPVVAGASSDLFGTRGREIVQLVGSTEITVADLGAPARRLVGSMGVSMTGRRVAVVDPAGTTASVVERDAEPAELEPVYVGSDLLRPMWDLTGALWLVDRGGEGTQVVVRREGRSRVLPVPSRDRVVLAALSRDGTRFAWVGARPGGAQRLWLSRVVRRPDGTPLRLAEPVQVPTESSWAGVRDLGWRDPITLAALSRPTRGTSQVRLVAVDGASELGGLRPAPGLLFERGLGLAASPGQPTALVVAAAGGRVHALNAQGRWDLDIVEPGLRHPAYVG